MEKVIDRIRKFRDDRNWKQFHKPEHLAKSISIEAAELLEHFQWGGDYEKQEVLEELADVMVYCIQMADALDVNLAEIIDQKMDKNEKKYPVNQAKGTPLKYNKL